MEGYCSTGQSPQRAVVPIEKEEEDILTYNNHFTCNHKLILSCTEFYEQATNKLNLYCPA
jgi:hypothetical protein